MLRAAFLCVAVVGANAGLPPVPPGTLFTWASKDGVVHVTDRLGDVPEPYYSTYKRELEAQAKKPPSKRPPAPPTTVSRTRLKIEPRGIAEREERNRKHWAERVATWRSKLLATTQALQSIDEKITLARQNPLLVHTPQVKAKLQVLKAERARAKNRVDEARRMLLEDIPRQAKKEQVPPAWIR